MNQMGKGKKKSTDNLIPLKKAVQDLRQRAEAIAGENIRKQLGAIPRCFAGRYKKTDL